MVEEADGRFNAYELKWKAGKKAYFPPAFIEAYAPENCAAVTRENYLQFV